MIAVGHKKHNFILFEVVLFVMQLQVTKYKILDLLIIRHESEQYVRDIKGMKKIPPK
ncbi:hypothetical protein [Bacillus paranthracis]|uniref:hypothetical protein n=1 Tax=Bacillus paranthracis TaxID=2026186 RepID=UPI001581DE20|nr:hypothetical protein [Bacillus paranthracis]NUJ05046.1 hypothetical protein [Bacillus paranthracis]